jgi:hypothetical protein
VTCFPLSLQTQKHLPEEDHAQTTSAAAIRPQVIALAQSFAGRECAEAFIAQATIQHFKRSKL